MKLKKMIVRLFKYFSLIWFIILSSTFNAQAQCMSYESWDKVFYDGKVYDLGKLDKVEDLKISTNLDSTLLNIQRNIDRHRFKKFVRSIGLGLYGAAAIISLTQTSSGSFVDQFRAPGYLILLATLVTIIGLIGTQISKKRGKALIKKFIRDFNGDTTYIDSPHSSTYVQYALGVTKNGVGLTISF